MSNVGNTGSVFIVPDLGQPLTLGPNAILIRGNKEIVDTKYLYYYFKSHEGINQIESISSATAQKKFNKTSFRNLQIPLPSLDTQKKIADALDKADEIRRKRQEAIDKLDELVQSVFLDMFGDPVKNEKNWKLKKFGEIGTLERGKSKHRPRNDEILLGGKYPLIQTGDVANSGGYITEYTQTYSEIGLKQSKLWDSGTLCITIAANIAKTGILTFDACFPDSVVGFKPDEKQTNTEFIQVWLSFLQKILEESAPESAQKNINLSILRDLDMIVPPIDKQNQFRSIYNMIFKEQDIMNNSDNDKNNLFNSLMQKAFMGELEFK
ncbi:restriction endonuclease subunit S [Candidatus Dojkabacteria bacterium]|uniref:Restriction endonuclease subunit S n=1 Tax=Candidatus Dojkabacteria bacterium TaxID=2099670 RepID=A0A955L6S8_9BACT|nr:restriction endonuclease subunit S [Candidatus Dojkabacteria bacterium]